MTQYILHPVRPARHHHVRDGPELSVIPNVSQGLNTAVRNRRGAFLLLLPHLLESGSPSCRSKSFPAAT